MKKISAILLALILVLSMSSVAMAAGNGSITINDAVVGQTYTIYRILELESYNESAEAYAYKATTAWSSFINGTDIKGVYVEVDAQGYVTWKTGANAAAFAKLAQAYAQNNSIANQGSVSATTTTVTFNDLELGYYLVDSTLGTLCSLDTTQPNVEMNEKNAAPTNEKKVEEDSTNAYGATNDADIGQIVNFKSTITTQAGADRYVFHDKMEAGLTLDANSIEVTYNGQLVGDSDNYSVSTNSADGCTFEVQFGQSFCDTLAANKELVITYSATLNENAVIGSVGNKNTSWVTYGDNATRTVDSTTTTKTWEVTVFKYTNTTSADAEEAVKSGLADATFTLSKNNNGSDPIALVNEGSNVYRVATDDEANSAVTEITTDSTGLFTIQGLDADTYYLTETAAPAGYNKLAGPVTVTIDHNGYVNATETLTTGVTRIEVENNTGSELPSTGGMGTTIFYVVGGLLMAAAVVLLVTKKKVSAR